MKLTNTRKLRLSLTQRKTNHKWKNYLNLSQPSIPKIIKKIKNNLRSKTYHQMARTHKSNAKIPNKIMKKANVWILMCIKSLTKANLPGKQRPNNKKLNKHKEKLIISIKKWNRNTNSISATYKWLHKKELKSNTSHRIIWVWTKRLQLR